MRRAQPGDDSPGASGIPADWWDVAWRHRTELTFNNVGQLDVLVDFPVLVRLTPSRIDYSKIDATGDDLGAACVRAAATVEPVLFGGSDGNDDALGSLQVSLDFLPGTELKQHVEYLREPLIYS